MAVRAERGNDVLLNEKTSIPVQAERYSPRLSPLDEKLQSEAISEKYRQRSEFLAKQRALSQEQDPSLQGYRRRGGR